MRRGSASALAISSNCFSVSGDRPEPVFFTVQWLSNYLPVVKDPAILRVLCASVVVVLYSLPIDRVDAPSHG